LEKILSSALPNEMKRKVDNKYISLENLWNKINEEYKIPSNVADLFNQSKLMVLNPSAHYQKLSQPIYKRELKNAFALIDELKKLDLQYPELLIEKGKRLIFKHPHCNYTFEFELNSDMVRNSAGANDPKCQIHTWQFNGTEFYDFNSKGVDDGYSKCTPKFSNLKSGLLRLDLPEKVDENCFLDNTTIEQGTLREVFDSK
jgi:hypothetical protein